MITVAIIVAIVAIAFAVTQISMRDGLRQGIWIAAVVLILLVLLDAWSPGVFRF